MIEKDNKDISVRQQCGLLSVNRSSLYYKKSEKKQLSDKELKNKITKIYAEKPFYGYRKIVVQLNKDGESVNKKRVIKLKKELGLETIYPKKNLSKASSDFQKYPFLLKNLRINRINQVWETDITYIKINGSFVYLVAIIDVYSRKVLSYQVSNTMTRHFCIKALEEAILKHGHPEIVNTDQGSQFTSNDFQEKLKKNNIKISMVGKGRATDNIYIERLWRSLKYEEIFIKSYENLIECKSSIKKYFTFYNQLRFHQSLDYRVPDEIYYANLKNSDVV